MAGLRIEDFINDFQLLDYTKSYPEQLGGLEALFPTRQVPDLVADLIKGAFNQHTSAEFYPFDVPTKNGQREGFDMGSVSLGFIKEKMTLYEKEIYYIENPRNSAERQSLLAKVYRDIEAIRGRILVRIERLRYEALTTGRIKVQDENGFNTEVDFGVPNNHKVTWNWSDKTHDIFQDLMDAKNTILKDTGFELSHGIVSPETMATLLQNETVRLQVHGDLNKSRFVTQAQLNTVLVEQGLPTLTMNNRTYKEKKVVKGKVQNTFVRYFPEDCIVLMPEGRMGETLRGSTPEARGLRNKGYQVQDGEITLTSYSQPDPVAHFVKGSTTAMVSFPYADQIIIGQLT